MKILLDCVVTAADPVKCSTNIQFLTFVNRTLERRSDVFFYWLIPHWVDDELFLASYPQHPNIKYSRVPMHKDRTKEYLTLPRELDDAVAFNGEQWDYDVMLTMRTGQMPTLRMLATSPRAFRTGWLREYWLLEAMVMMEFKPTVLTFAPKVQDLWVLNGYMAADRVWLTSQIDKDPILQRARELLTPSHVRDLGDKIVPVGYALFSESSVKTADQFPDPENGKPFCIAHAGRMEKMNRIEEINSVMVNSFVMKGDRVKLLVCTVSDGSKAFDTSVVDVKQASRDEFWELCKHDMHVVINFAPEGGSSMALLEPMMLGVPAIVGPRKAYAKSLGDDYPFLVNSETEAYALTKMFYDDYATMYAKFAEWHETRFKQLVKERFEERLIYNLMDKAVDDFALTDERVRKEKASKETNQLVLDLVKYAEGKDEFVFKDAIEELVATKVVSASIMDKLKPGDRDKRGLVWANDFNEIRRLLQVFYGWEDASVAVGHLKRKAS